MFSGRRHDPQSVFLAVDEGGTAAGFAEPSIRHGVEGCDTDRVAYLEGWYVAPQPAGYRAGAHRGGGTVGAKTGLAEFASDTQPDTRISILAHRALGFQDAGMVRCFKKRVSIAAAHETDMVP